MRRLAVVEGLLDQHKDGHWPPLPDGLEVSDPEHIVLARSAMVDIFLKVFSKQYLDEYTLEDALNSLQENGRRRYQIANRWLRSEPHEFIDAIDNLIEPSPIQLRDDVREMARADHWSNSLKERECRASHLRERATAWFDAGVWSDPDPINDASTDPKTLFDVWLEVVDIRINDLKSNLEAFESITGCTATVESNYYAANNWLSMQVASFYAYAQNRIKDIEYQHDYYQVIRDPLSLLHPASTDGNQWDWAVEEKRYGNKIKNAIRAPEKKLWSRVIYKYNPDKSKTNPKKQEVIDLLGYKDIVGVARMYDEMDEQEVNQMISNPRRAVLSDEQLESWDGMTRKEQKRLLAKLYAPRRELTIEQLRALTVVGEVVKITDESLEGLLDPEPLSGIKIK